MSHRMPYVLQLLVISMWTYFQPNLWLPSLFIYAIAVLSTDVLKLVSAPLEWQAWYFAVCVKINDYQMGSTDVMMHVLDSNFAGKSLRPQDLQLKMFTVPECIFQDAGLIFHRESCKFLLGHFKSTIALCPWCTWNQNVPAEIYNFLIQNNVRKM